MQLAKAAQGIIITTRRREVGKLILYLMSTGYHRVLIFHSSDGHLPLTHWKGGWVGGGVGGWGGGGVLGVWGGGGWGGGGTYGFGSLFGATPTDTPRGARF